LPFKDSIGRVGGSASTAWDQLVSGTAKHVAKVTNE
jgi:hypothetical protein